MLASPRLKIARAQGHVDELISTGAHWAGGRGCRFAIHPDTVPGGAQILHIETDDVRGPTSAVVGEVIYQLRSALDVSLNVIARSEGKMTNTSHIYFPFVGTEHEFDIENGVAQRKMFGLPQSVRKVVRSLAPWTGPGGNEALTGLNKLRNEDVHNDLITVEPEISNGMSVASVNISRSMLAASISAKVMAARNRSLVPIADLRVDVTNSVKDLHAVIGVINSDIKICSSLVFANTVTFAGEPVVATLQELCVVVDDVIGLLEGALY
jgi:hypothetical protein